MEDDNTPFPFSAETLEIQTSRGNLILEPIARKVYGADGRVDLYAYPTLFRVKLLYGATEDHWIVRTDSGIDWPNPWGEDTFAQLAEALLREI